MRAGLVTSLLLAAFAAIVIGVGQLLGLDLQHVALLGAALGGALGLVPSPAAGKLGGFALGFVLAWIGFALRAAVLPDSAGGRAVAAFAVVAVLGVACALSLGRMPLWSGLLGAAAIVGAYEETYTNAPSQFLAQSPGAATTVLLAVALGYLAATLLPAAGQAPGRHSADADGRPADDDPEESADAPVSLDTSGAGDEPQPLDRLMAGDR